MQTYDYCQNDPVNYVDSTGEIANILAGGLIGGVMGGVFGFAGPAFSQISSGEEFSFRRAAGSAVNGAVTGSVRGALLGSGAALSAIDYLFGKGGTRESAGRRAPGGNGRSDRLSPYAQRRDPRNGCRKSSVNGNGIWNEKTYGYQYHIPGYESSRQRKPEGFSLAEFVKAAVLGVILGGLSGAAFYGLDKATRALRRSVERNVIYGSDGIKKYKYNMIENPGPLAEMKENPA